MLMVQNNGTHPHAGVGMPPLQAALMTMSPLQFFADDRISTAPSTVTPSTYEPPMTEAQAAKPSESQAQPPCPSGLYACSRHCVAATVARLCGKRCITGPAGCGNSTCQLCVGPSNSTTVCTLSSPVGKLQCGFHCQPGFRQTGKKCRAGPLPPVQPGSNK